MISTAVLDRPKTTVWRPARRNGRAQRWASVSAELRARMHGETEATELAARLAAVSTEHLHELTALPNAAVRQFNKELAAADQVRKGA